MLRNIYYNFGKIRRGKSDQPDMSQGVTQLELTHRGSRGGAGQRIRPAGRSGPSNTHPARPITIRSWSESFYLRERFLFYPFNFPAKLMVSNGFFWLREYQNELKR